MKVEIQSQLLLKALKTLSKIKDLIPIQIDVTGDIVTLIKGNSNTEIRTKIKGFGYENGKTLIPHETADIITKIKDGLITLSENEIKAGSKSIKYEENLFEGYYPEPTLMKEVFSTTEKELHRMLEVKYAVAKDETRPVLCGLYFNKNETCALDGYRLSLRKGSYNSEASFVVNKETIKILDSLLDVKSNCQVRVSYDAKLEKVQFDNGLLTITGDTIPGEFIKYRSIIPEDFKTTSKINLNILKGELDFISGLKNQYMKLNFTEDKLLLITNQCKEQFDRAASYKKTEELQGLEHKAYMEKYNEWAKKKTVAEKKKKTFKTKEPQEKTIRPQKVYELIPVAEIKIEVDCSTKFKFSESEFQIACNSKYFIEGLETYKDCIELKMSSSVSPIVITEDNENLELILPIRIIN